MGNLGPTELLIILLILVVLFGAKKLPDLARGTGRALRIFKAETKGVMDDDDEEPQKAPPQITSTNVVQPQPTEPGRPAPAAEPLPPTHTEK